MELGASSHTSVGHASTVPVFPCPHPPPDPRRELGDEAWIRLRPRGHHARRAALDDRLDVAARMALGLVLLVAAVAAWVRRRDRIRARIRQFMDEGRAQTTQQRSTR